MRGGGHRFSGPTVHSENISNPKFLLEAIGSRQTGQFPYSFNSKRMMPSEEIAPVRVVCNGALETSEDIVISGISMRCSQSDNIEEFADNFFNRINMVHEDFERCGKG